jgi:hypothetical protein
VNFCQEPGCLELAAKRFCAKHVADNYAKRQNTARPERDGWYSLAAWRGPYGARGYKLRNSPMCEQVGCDKVATDVHHIDDSWKVTGDFRLFIDQANLKSLCHECHSRITLKEQQNG